MARKQKSAPAQNFDSLDDAQTLNFEELADRDEAKSIVFSTDSSRFRLERSGMARDDYEFA